MYLLDTECTAENYSYSNHMWGNLQLQVIGNDGKGNSQFLIGLSGKKATPTPKNGPTNNQKKLVMYLDAECTADFTKNGFSYL